MTLPPDGETRETDRESLSVSKIEREGKRATWEWAREIHGKKNLFHLFREYVSGQYKEERERELKQQRKIH